MKEMTSDEQNRRNIGGIHNERRGLRFVPWLHSLGSDIDFGWRLLKKRKLSSVAAILSLGLAIGACVSVFRLVDALLLRHLPVAGAERLYVLAHQGVLFDDQPGTFDSWAYPAFLQMRAAVNDQADLLAISYAKRIDLTYRSDQETERAWLQYVSGWMFDTFGLQPALGRLLMEADDQEPGAHPYAVLSHDYWTRRFGRDPDVIGRTFRMGGNLFEIVGVAAKPFTGTEPGTVTDIFIPTMMHPHVTRPDSQWFRTFVQLRPKVAVEPVRARLHAVSRAFEEERLRGTTGMPQEMVDRFLNLKVVMQPAAAGASGMQDDYWRSLVALSVLVGLLLLIACANVANLMTVRATARAREMALRVSLGAGRAQLVQLVLMESAWMAFFAATIGALFAAWSAPFLVGTINPSDNPAHLSLPVDWRVLGFGVALTVISMLLFGLAPATRASAVKPMSALKGGDDPHSHRPLMHALIAAQLAFCFLVLFVAGLFLATFERLSHRPTGFSAERLLTLETVAERAQPPEIWNQLVEDVRRVPGVENVALAGWPLLTRNSWNDYPSIDDGPSGTVLAYYLNISPGWTDAMQLPIIDGRDLRASDMHQPVALINQAFAKAFFNGKNPIGRHFVKDGNHYEVVGLVRDALYQSMREPILPQAYLPFHWIGAGGVPRPIRTGTIIVRTSSRNSLALAPTLRREVRQAHPEFRVTNIQTQGAINRTHTVRERLLARLATFFGLVALLLVGVGVYGVFDHSVLQRRREIGIRMALGAQRREVLGMVVRQGMIPAGIGVLAGLGAVVALTRLLQSLLYDIGATDPAIFAGATVLLAFVVFLACWLPARRATRINPVEALRAE